MMKRAHLPSPWEWIPSRPTHFTFVYVPPLCMISIFLLASFFVFLCFLNESMLSRASSAFSCGNPCKENHVV